MKSEVDIPTGQVSYKELYRHQEQSIPIPGLTIFSHWHQNLPVGSEKLIE